MKPSDQEGDFDICWTDICQHKGIVMLWIDLYLQKKSYQVGVIENPDFPTRKLVAFKELQQSQKKVWISTIH